MKRPHYLLPRNRHKAIHWLVPDEPDGLLTTACGTAVAYMSLRANLTEEPEAITCKDCWDRANPPFNYFADETKSPWPKRGETDQ